MVNISNVDEKTVIIYNDDLSKGLKILVGGNLDYYMACEIFNGELEDNKISFIIDKKDEKLYEIFNSFYLSIKNITNDLNNGIHDIVVPSFAGDMNISSYNSFDKHELYDKENDRIVWYSEEGYGVNTFVTFEHNEDGFNIVFDNEDDELLVRRKLRSICVCNSGSRSNIMPFIFGKLFHDVKDIGDVKKLIKKGV